MTSIAENMRRAQQQAKALKKICKNVQFDVDLRQFSTIRIGGMAACVVTPTASCVGELEDELYSILRFCQENILDCYTIGNGSNTVFGDIPGVIIHTKNMNKFWIEDDKIRTFGGALLPLLSKAAEKSSLSGLEFAIGIPGTIGAAVVNNSSCYLQSVGQVTQAVQTVGAYSRDAGWPDRVCGFRWEKPDTVEVGGKMYRRETPTGDFRTRLPVGIHIGDKSVRDLDFGYRSSVFSLDYFDRRCDYSPNFREVIYLVELKLAGRRQQEISERMKLNTEHRRLHQPKGLSVGSVFKRREGYTGSDPRGVGAYNAEEMIKQAGCQTGKSGWQVGDIYMSEKNPNFFINAGNGTLVNFLELLSRVENQVFAECGVRLRHEVDIIPNHNYFYK